jgi:hypothetical protein
MSATTTAVFLLSAISGFASAQITAAPGTTTIPVIPPSSNATEALYTSFDLFKNSGFSPCAINTNKTADPTTKSFVVSRNVFTQSDFCSFQAGIPIMIPTAPTDTAFFPWWPTQLVQGFSLTASYFGLFVGLRIIDRRRMTYSSRKIPWSSWLQLLLDLARVVLWLFKVIHSFFNATTFAWVNVVLWLLPLNYFVIVTQLRRETSFIVEEPYAGAEQQLRQLRDLDFGDSVLRSNLTATNDKLAGRSIFSPNNSQVGRMSLLPSNRGGYARREPRGAGAYACGALAGVMVFLTIVVLVLHWKWAFGVGTFTMTYTELVSALTDPSSLGTLPETCLGYLQTGALSRSDFFRQTTDQLTFSLLETFQFIAAMVVIIPTMFFARSKEPFDKAYRILIASAAVTVVTLWLPVLALGIDIAVKRNRERQRVNMRFTNDLTATGGCTFAFVNMDRALGYWDVPANRAFRIILSFLGAA